MNFKFQARDRVRLLRTSAGVGNAGDVATVLTEIDPGNIYRLEYDKIFRNDHVWLAYGRDLEFLDERAAVIEDTRAYLEAITGE